MEITAKRSNIMPTKEWLDELEKYRDKLVCPNDLNEYFENRELFGVKTVCCPIGTISLPTGELIGCDPLVYLQNDAESFYIKAPAGEFPVELCVVEPPDGDCARYAAMRIKYSDKRAVRYELALTGSEDLSEIADFEEGDYFGFPVDAGLGCFCDKTAQKAYTAFDNEMYQKHGEGFNFYNDYMAALFAESYNADPRYQREGGDFINYTVPGTEYHIPMCNSGFGDGMYPVYWGYDEDGNICQTVMQFIDIKLAYGGNE